MIKYLLSMYQPDREPGPEVDLDTITRELGELREEMKDAAQAYDAALALTGNAAERAFLLRRREAPRDPGAGGDDTRAS